MYPYSALINSSKSKSASISRFKWLVIFTLLISFILCCGKPPKIKREYPEFKTKRCVEYQLCQNVNDFHLAIKPLLERDLVNYYFGKDLISRGVVPIFVVAENNSKSSTYMLLLDQTPSTSITEAKEEVFEYKAPDTSTIVMNAIWYGGMGVWGCFAENLDHLKKESSSIKQNMTIKSICQETLSPGKSQSGFIYLHLPEDSNNINKSKFIINVMDVKLRKVHSFCFEINI